MAGFLAAAGLIGGAASAAGYGLADSHKRAGDVGGADVIFQTATADDVFCLEHHCGFHFRRVFVDNGSIASTLAASLSFEKRYTLNVIVTDFTGDFDLLIVPVLAWLRENQPDIMTTDEGQKKGFTFYADINNDSSFDISISLMLTERTLVSEVDGALHVKNIPEPPPPEPVTRPMELYINGELVSKWDE